MAKVSSIGTQEGCSSAARTTSKPLFFYRLCYILGCMKGRGSISFAVANGRGYTVVEVIVFLAVSSALFVIIAATFSGRQAATEFSAATREMESRLQDIANDVSTGFYSNPGNFNCQVTSGAPVITGVPSGALQGTNQDCIFIGRVAQFDLGGSNGRQYNLYSVVGARQFSDHDVEDFDEAQPRAIAQPTFATDLTETEQIPPGLTVRSMYAQYGPNRRRIRAVGFFSSFGSSAAADPTSLSVNIIPLGFAPIGNDKDDVVTDVPNVTTAYADAFGNPDGGVVVCMEGEGTDQHALLRLGGRNRQLATDLTIGESTCDSVGYPA
jgi:hypothetical protein